MSDPEKLSSLLVSSTATAPCSRPKIFVINSHGKCPSHLEPIQKLPVDVVTACKLGSSHFRALFKPGTDELSPHLTLSFKEMLKKQPSRASLSEQALESIKEMSALGITDSHPELHRVDTSMRDIELFCPGAAMAEGVYAIYSDDTMLDVSTHFGLETVKHSDRIGFACSTSKFPKQLPDKMVKALNDVRDKLNKQKSEISSKPAHVKQTLQLEIEHYNSTVDMVNSMSTTSRVQPGNKLLSNILDIGMQTGIINPETDCVVVFACRKIKDRPILVPLPPFPSPSPSPSPVGRPRLNSKSVVSTCRKIKKHKKTRRLKLKNKYQTKRIKQLKSAPDRPTANTRISHQAMAGV